MSRLIDNKIWNKRSFTSLSMEDKLLFIYLETSPETNYYGVFELPNDVILSQRTSIPLEGVSRGLEGLIKGGKIALEGDYIIIADYFDRQLANNSEKTSKGLENFQKALPQKVLNKWLEINPLGGGIKRVSSPLEESKEKENKEEVKESKKTGNPKPPNFGQNQTLRFPDLTKEEIELHLTNIYTQYPDFATNPTKKAITIYNMLAEQNKEKLFAKKAKENKNFDKIKKTHKESDNYPYKTFKREDEKVDDQVRKAPRVRKAPSYQELLKNKTPDYDN